MIGFLLAGFETTSSTLNYSLYMMVKHPDKAKKLQAEVDSCFEATNVTIIENTVETGQSLGDGNFT